jgi:hypothetical protein
MPEVHLLKNETPHILDDTTAKKVIKPPIGSFLLKATKQTKLQNIGEVKMKDVANRITLTTTFYNS